MNTFVESSTWHDAGQETPENALQTLLWAENTGNNDRIGDLLTFAGPPELADMQPDGFHLVSDGFGIVVMVDKDTGEASYNALEGAQITKRRELAAGVVELTATLRHRVPGSRSSHGLRDAINESQTYEFRREQNGWKYALKMHLEPDEPSANAE
jgi:hypothetical protein